MSSISFLQAGFIPRMHRPVPVLDELRAEHEALLEAGDRRALCDFAQRAMVTLERRVGELEEIRLLSNGVGRTDDNVDAHVASGLIWKLAWGSAMWDNLATEVEEAGGTVQPSFPGTALRWAS